MYSRAYLLPRLDEGSNTRQAGISDGDLAEVACRMSRLRVARGLCLLLHFVPSNVQSRFGSGHDAKLVRLSANRHVATILNGYADCFSALGGTLSKLPNRDKTRAVSDALIIQFPATLSWRKANLHFLQTQKRNAFCSYEGLPFRSRNRMVQWSYHASQERIVSGLRRHFGMRNCAADE